MMSAFVWFYTSEKIIVIGGDCDYATVKKAKGLELIAVGNRCRLWNKDVRKYESRHW